MFNGFSEPEVVNCVFWNNWAKENGGGVCNYETPSEVIIENSIFWGNTTNGWGSQVSNVDCQALINHSNVQGGCPIPECTSDSTGNIDAVPLFTDHENGDFSLDPNSPCINKGNNQALPPDVLDLDGDNDSLESISIDYQGNPRISDTIVDMGAIEAPAAGSDH